MRKSTSTSFTEQHFWLLLAVVVLAALAWRVLYVGVLVTKNPGFGDGFYYHQQANLLADGHGFANPWAAVEFNRIIPAAVHPPLYSLALAIPSMLGAESYLAHKLMSCLIGAGAVLVVGLVGRRVGGPRAGIIAATIAALYPNLWVLDSLLFSEGLFALLIGLTILSSYRFRERPTWGNVAVLGGLVAAATLTRGEALFLSVFLIAPLVLMTKDLDLRRRVRLLAIAAGVVIVVLAPWVIRNLTSFEEPFLLSSNSDSVLRVANCDTTYSGYLVGYYAIRCGGGIPDGDGEESKDAKNDREIALDYLSRHTRQIPRVVAARIGRAWDVYRPFQNARLSRIEGRHPRVTHYGLYAYWVVLPLGLAGMVVLYRRRITLIPLAAQLVLVTFVAVAAYGALRFRVPAEVALIALAGVSLDAGLGWLFRRPGSRPLEEPEEPVAEEPVPEPAGGSA